MRFIHYFEAFFKGIIKSPQIKYLKQITIYDVPVTSSLSDGCNKPFYEIYHVNGLQETKMYDNRNDEDQCRFYFKQEGCIKLRLPKKIRLYGNIMIKFKYATTFSTADLFRVTFNTAFIGMDNELKINRNQISPESLHKDYEKFSKQFSCKFTFSDFCQNCRSHSTYIEKLCHECKRIMLDELDHWYKATKVM